MFASSNGFETSKRGSEELGNPNDSGIKRVRHNSNEVAPPSKVIHVRNVPYECTEAELYTLCAPFGRVENVLVVFGKGQAFVQMVDQAGATAVVDFYANNPAVLRTNTIYLQYSTRQELKNKAPLQIPGMPGSHPNQMPAPPQLQSHPESPQLQQHPQLQQQQLQPQQLQQQQRNEPPSQDACVLLVTISNIQYPVTIDLLYQVFSKYGPVTKVVTFMKNSGLQAFVQFSHSAAASTAKQALDGQNIYVGCCLLRIHYSTTRDLDVKYNNDKSRDFTNQYLPAGPAHAMNGGGGGDYMSQPPPQQHNQHNQHHHHNNHQQHSYGDSMNYPPYQQGPPAPFHSQHTPYMPQFQGGGAQSPVIIVSGLTERTTPDDVCTLFRLYGDVLKVKILYNKKDQCLVQFTTPQQAEAAMSYLNGCPLHDAILRVNISRHTSIMTPSSNDDNPALTKEYTGQNATYRFRFPDKAYKNISGPAATLHLSSIPQSSNEEHIRSLFAQYGQVDNVKFFPGDKKMALVQMASIPDAVNAVLHLSNHQFEDSNLTLRIAFAKSTIFPNNTNN